MGSKKLKFSDQIRKAIKDDKLTCYAISKATKIDESDLSKFVNEKKKKMLSLKSLDKLAELLNLQVIKKSDKKAGD